MLLLDAIHADACAEWCQQLLTYPVLQRWDWLFLSGNVALWAGLWFSRPLSKQFDDMLAQLDASQLIQGDLSDIRLVIQKWVDWFGISGAVMLASLILFEIADTYRNESYISSAEHVEYIGLGLIGMIGGCLVGERLGRMCAFGQLSTIIQRCGARLTVQPEHVDRMAGLRPIGEFYYYQAMLLALPIALMSVGWMFLTDTYFDDWQKMILNLIVVGILVEIASFVLPIWGFRQMLVAQKETWKPIERQLAEQLMLTKQIVLTSTVPPLEAVAAAHRATMLERSVQAIQSLPLLPLDESLRSRFTIRNVVLIVFPIFGRYLGEYHHELNILQEVLSLFN